ncbi:hypothetical protein [uncultured Psychroserpens sp.]|uniref:hypothetical protein n=1 Tax=uncultured Psychroserpens sp. TaxID=255436 RepID=UPI0026265AD6|nr:hypothetical protein [uncultured Psychroserpens sp.]
MKKILILFSIVIIICNCESNKKNNHNPINKDNIHLVHFLERKVYLPNNFKRSSIETFTELIKSSIDLDTLSNYELERLNNLSKLNENVEIFIGNNNYLNSISFQSSPYFEFGKEAVAMYVDLLENQLLVEPRSRGVEFERLESKYLKYGISKIVKVKYLQRDGNRTGYLTHYLISYKLYTFGIIVSNEHGNDYQFILRNFKK